MWMKQSMLTKIFKYSLMGCGTFVVLVVALVSWISFALFSGPDAMDTSSPFHPFRSEKAKAQYLTHYDQRAKDWPVSSEDRLVETSYGETFVRVSGPVDAPPLVLLPGGGATSLIWRRNVRDLSDHFRTYAVDNVYDFGRSTHSRSMTSTDDCLAWLDELFRVLDLGDKINLAGLSYGGWLAGQYAVNHPDRLAGVVLVAPAATVLPFSGEFLWRSAVCVIPLRHFTQSTMDWVWEDLVREGEDGRRITDDRVDDVMLAFRSFKFRMPVNPTVLTDVELEGLSVPALFLIGENEKIYSAQDAVHRLEKVAPHIKTAVLPGTGHDLTILRSTAVNNAIIDFLETPGPVSPSG